jgi:hypothetical protein
MTDASRPPTEARREHARRVIDAWLRRADGRACRACRALTDLCVDRAQALASDAPVEALASVHGDILSLHEGPPALDDPGGDEAAEAVRTLLGQSSGGGCVERREGTCPGCGRIWSWEPSAQQGRDGPLVGRPAPRERRPTLNAPSSTPPADGASEPSYHVVESSFLVRVHAGP